MSHLVAYRVRKHIDARFGMVISGRRFSSAKANGKLGLSNLSPQCPYLPAKEKLRARTGED